MDEETLRKMLKYNNAKKQNPQKLRIAANPELVNQFLHSDVNSASIKAVQEAGDVLAGIESKYNNDDINGKTPEELLHDIKGQFNDAQLNALFEDCKTTVIDSIIGPFGLSNEMFHDKNGGNVTTIHNAKKGIYATEEDTYKRDNYYYNKEKKTNTQSYMDKYKSSKIIEGGKVIDEYTGEKLDVKDTQTDHIYPLKKFHVNGGYMLSDDEKQSFARDSNNYAVTKGKVNESKSEDDLEEFENKVVQKETDKNKKRFSIDDRRTNAKRMKGEKTANEYLPSNFHKFNYYAKKSALTGFGVGAKYGVQQVVGLILREIALEIFDQVRDIYRNGFCLSAKSVFESLKARINAVVKKVKDKWKDYLAAFKNGAVTGFLSNFATTLINIFATTESKIVKMIREGAISLYGAAKLLIHHPNDMTLPQAAHEASKLIIAGLGAGFGIIINEALQGFVVTVSGPFAPLAGIISSVVSGLATGIFTLVAVYLVDKIDLFGVKADEKNKFIADSLSEKQESIRDETKEYIHILNGD